MRIAPLIAIALAVGSGVTAQEESGRLEAEARGTLYWVFSDQLDLAGETGVALWMPPTLGWQPGVVLDAQTAIQRANGLSFAVRSLNYRAELAARSSRHPWLMGFVGQRGRGNVDSNGHAFVRYAGVGLAAGGARWRGDVALGVVFSDQRVDADALLRVRAEGFAPWGRLAVGFSARVELLDERERTSIDYTAGPMLLFGWSRSHALALFARYHRAESALGLQASGWQAGFEIAHAGWKLNQMSQRRVLSGAAAAGTGTESRHHARFDLRAESPELHGSTRAVIEVDANLLTASDTRDLFYFVWLGVERPWRSGTAALQLYHRSDHRLARDGAVKSTNYAEIGWASQRWREPPARPGAWDLSLFAGAMLDSDFGEDRRAMLRGGVRWALPRSDSRWLPYLRGEAEWGDANRYSLAVGVERDTGIALELSQRRDDQWFSRVGAATLLTLSQRF
ncbi:MAG: hypothetical protein U0V87_18115 [Acidobacteriota bacterium]